MFLVTPNGENRVDIELSGKLDRDEMRAALDALVEATEGIEHGRMLYRITEFNFPSLPAIGVELARLPAMFKLIRQFDKAAVLCEETWIRRISELEGAFFPGLEIKAFRFSEEDAAEAWLES
jgi:hypothetical protein